MSEVESAEAFLKRLEQRVYDAEGVDAIKARDMRTRAAAIRECAEEVYSWNGMSTVQEARRERILALLNPKPERSGT